MKNLLLALLSGLLFAISWPTYGFPLFLFLAFVPLLHIEKEIREQNSKQSNLRVLSYSYLSFLIFKRFICDGHQYRLCLYRCQHIRGREDNVSYATAVPTEAATVPDTRDM